MPDQPPRPPAIAATGEVTSPQPSDCAALTAIRTRFESMLVALEARPSAEGPLEALTSVIASEEGQVLTANPEEIRALALLDSSPSLAGRFLWKTQVMIDRLAVDFGRRQGVPHTDLRPQLQAATVAAAFYAVLRSWLASPPGPTLEDLLRQGLAHLAEGFVDPSEGFVDPSESAAAEGSPAPDVQ